jgi:hypothetical protein
MFQTPALIVMTIAATRMYRSLIEFSDHRYYASCVLHSVFMLTAADVALLSIPIGLERGSAEYADPKLSFGPAIPLNRVEVTLHRSSEVYPPANMGQYENGVKRR